MKAGTILLIVRDIVTDLVSGGLLTSTGDFTKPTIANILTIASTVNATITKYGVTEPAQIQQIISLLTTIGPMFGSL